MRIKEVAQTPELSRGWRRSRERRQRGRGAVRRAQSRSGSLRPTGVDRGDELGHPFEPTEIASRAEHGVQGADRFAIDELAVALEDEMRRTKQRHGGLPRETGFDELEDEVERGGVRFRGERKRVERLVRESRLAEDLARQIQIWQWALEHDRDAIEGSRRHSIRSQTSRDRDQFLFAIASHEDELVGIRARNHQRRPRPARRRPFAASTSSIPGSQS